MTVTKMAITDLLWSRCFTRIHAAVGMFALETFIFMTEHTYTHPRQPGVKQHPWHYLNLEMSEEKCFLCWITFLFVMTFVNVFSILL